ncbi:hypothetical protein HA402_011693 [Bradysia odoriphaga]|nr:hypothetical protein HA402_011693 [Bradysia odoriphaga]
MIASNDYERQVEDVRIKVPWGHIAGKWWGSKSVRPILCLHGWQDNSGSFDPVILQLPGHISYLAIDLPGHGHSSRIGDGMIYSLEIYFYSVMLICDHYRWEKVSLMGHSLGSVVSFFYASTFPNKCDMVIGFDTLKPYRSLDADVRNRQKQEPPSYTYEELLTKIKWGIFLRINDESAPYLLQRAVLPSATHPNKYYFARDNRLKAMPLPMMAHDMLIMFAKNISSPYCFIKSSLKPKIENQEHYDEIVQIMSKNLNFEIHSVDGDHHVHLNDSDKVQEIQIEFPWGHVAGKWWGPQNVRPIVSLHGWQDNAGTFDRLIPLLPSHMSYLAIDLPGHGLSSHLPDGVSYNTLDFLYVIRSICEKYKWDKMSIMGHSMSAQLGYLYAAVFPDKIDMLISFEVLKTHSQGAEKTVNRISKSIDFILAYDARKKMKIEPPCYIYEEIVNRLYEASSKSVTREAAPYLLKRSIAQSTTHPGRFYFSRDNRLRKFNYLTPPHEVNLELAKRIVCPHLFIKTTNAELYEDENLYLETLNLFKEKPNFKFISVESTHHFHLTDPTKISADVSAFINEYRPH